MNKKYQGCVGRKAGIPIEGFYSCWSVCQAFHLNASVLQLGTRLSAELRAFGHHLSHVGCMLGLVIGPIELGLRQVSPDGSSQSMVVPEALMVVLREALSLRM